VVSDKVYGSRALIELIHDHRVQAVIPHSRYDKLGRFYLVSVMRAPILICSA